MNKDEIKATSREKLEKAYRDLLRTSRYMLIVLITILSAYTISVICIVNGSKQCSIAQTIPSEESKSINEPMQSYWWNFKTSKMELLSETPTENMKDYIPQDRTSQELFAVCLANGKDPCTAAIVVLSIWASEHKKGEK